MRLVDFDYDLPEELIAQTPVEPRDAARLLMLDRHGDAVSDQSERQAGALAHRHVRDLPDLLRPGDLLVANRSRVLPARVRGRLKGGGQAELLLLKRLAVGCWEVLARPARRLRPGDIITIDERLSVRISAAQPEGIRQIEVVLRPHRGSATEFSVTVSEDSTVGGSAAAVQESAAGSFDAASEDPDAALLAAGSVPLPPYIRSWLGDPERYQTIFADIQGSAAAPTAGLHFTQDLLDRLADAGVAFSTLVLHVGLDTFRPIAEHDPSAHHMHREWYTVPPELQLRIAETRARGGRIVAVGTTSVRSLETWAATGEPEGWTDLFILPGFRFNLVDALLTNFHLPRSTLLMLVSAFAGRDRVLAAYAEAIRQAYRFYSFGDAMLILPEPSAVERFAARRAG